MSSCEKFYGKYRGTVINNVDPLQMGRIQVSVPDVSGLLPSSWAMPCVPVAGKQMGTFAVPQQGAGVWIEFEHGDPDYPIWVGGYWGTAAEVPALALAGIPASPNIVVQTAGQNAFVLSDVPGPTGGITLMTKEGALISVSDTGIVIQRAGASITLGDSGIVIQNGQGAIINMTGPIVDVNQQALEIK